MSKLKQTIMNDNELNKKYVQFSREYDVEQILKQLYHNDNNISEILSYRYYYIRHYKHDVYQKRKIDYKKRLIKNSQVTGKIECGPFKEQELPVEAIDKLRFEERRKEIICRSLKIVFVLSFQPFTGQSIHSIIESESKDVIKLALRDLETLDMVVKLDYSYSKPELMNEQSNNAAIHNFNLEDDDNNLYYLLNLSKPECERMLADCRKRFTKREILNMIEKMAEYSQDESSVHNRDDEEKVLPANVGKHKTCNLYDQGIGHVLEHAKRNKENGKSPLLALLYIRGIDLKDGILSYTNMRYIEAWKSMERDGLLEDGNSTHKPIVIS
jgi:hypothetical protein